MRKIDEKDYIDFTYTDDGFTVRMSNFHAILTLFQHRKHGKITGRKASGDIAIIDQK